MAILVQSNKKPSVTFPSQTGSIVTFNSQYAGLPLKSCKVNIPVTQEGTGDPSPDNVRNFVGYSAIDIGNSNAYDTNIEQGTLNNSGLNGDATNRIRTADYIPVISGHTYKITLKGDGAYYLGVSGYTANDYTTPRTQSTSWLSNNTDLLIDAGVKYIRINVRFMNSTDIAPADLTGILVTDITNYFSIQFGQTIYAGELDVLTGIFTATHGYIASYNGETVNEPWLSSMDVYAEGTTPTIGAQVVYPLTTPEVINLGGMEIATLQGENNLFASTGDTTVQHIKIGG